MNREFDVRERLAEEVHDIWASWMNYLLLHSIETSTGSVIIPVEKVQRWKRQMNTRYLDLPEEERFSDRHIAGLIMTALGIEDIKEEQDDGVIG